MRSIIYIMDIKKIIKKNKKKTRPLLKPYQKLVNLYLNILITNNLDLGFYIYFTAFIKVILKIV